MQSKSKLKGDPDVSTLKMSTNPLSMSASDRLSNRHRFQQISKGGGSSSNEINQLADSKERKYSYQVVHLKHPNGVEIPKGGQIVQEVTLLNDG